MNKRCTIFVLVLTTILWAIFIAFVLKAQPVEAAETKKTVSQSTSAENKVRKQLFNQCVASGKSRSQCYYLYY